MKIAIEGCAHGDLANIYATLQHLEQTENTKIDLLLCCGDFQAVRNLNDLESLACPPKYRAMNSFWKYYSGQEKAPYPTLFIGGNHEASNYLWELFYGGWAAPNIFFLGFAGIIRFGGLRIGGLSGIYKSHDYRAGHFERPPYNGNEIRSIYHVREYDVTKLMQVKEPVDIFMSHDWPRGIVSCGNKQALLRHKPFFEEEVERNSLGSEPAQKLLQKLKPMYWFSAHLHTKFAALVEHGNNQVTKFLALDKCLPGKNFLQVIDIPAASGPLEFSYDEEWLAITRAYNPVFPLSRSPSNFLNEKIDLSFHRQFIEKCISENGGTLYPAKFCATVSPYDPSQSVQEDKQHAGHIKNPQTVALLELLGLQYLLDSIPSASASRMPHADDLESKELPDDVDELESASGIGIDVHDPDEIILDDEDDQDVEHG